MDYRTDDFRSFLKGKLKGMEYCIPEDFTEGEIVADKHTISKNRAEIEQKFILVKKMKRGTNFKVSVF